MSAVNIYQILHVRRSLGSLVLCNQLSPSTEVTLVIYRAGPHCQQGSADLLNDTKKKKKTGCLPGFGGDSDHLLITPVSLKVSSRPQTEILMRRFQMFSQMSNKVQTEDRRRVFPFPLEYFTKLWGLITLVKTHGHFHSALNHRYVTVPCKRLEPRPFL